MDRLDLKILEALDWNCRKTNKQIAKEVGSNKDVVSYRISRMEKNGTITRYYPVLDMYKLGYNTSRIYFDLEEINPKEEKE